ncbi:hypothetical protein [Actinomadura parmotrematis]|uniref:Acyltransferase n=1 Tax=Actinomadura parmotrematis TaxID=2864039 RepID=A0ABS7FU07_9ACTN|nr:hypothetical protein [Actinomadura parmotrematis]MBW8483889.1 hypothetical protein [Actinomadura parmotrematis]
MQLSAAFRQGAERAARRTARRTVQRAVHGAWERVQDYGAVTARAPGRHRFAHFGEGVRIAFPAATLYGEPWISIGAHTLVGAQVTLAAGLVPGLDLGPDVIVRIGGVPARVLRAYEPGAGRHRPGPRPAGRPPTDTLERGATA